MQENIPNKQIGKKRHKGGADYRYTVNGEQPKAEEKPPAKPVGGAEYSHTPAEDK